MDCAFQRVKKKKKPCKPVYSWVVTVTCFPLITLGFFFFPRPTSLLLYRFPKMSKISVSRISTDYASSYDIVAQPCCS